MSRTNWPSGDAIAGATTRRSSRPAALLATLGGSVGYGVASVLQAWAAGRAHGPAVVRHPAYLIGLGCDTLAWLASLYALHALPLFTVQALLAGSLVITALLGRVVLHIRLSRRDAVAITVVTAALIVVVASAGTPSDAGPPVWFTPVLLVCLAAAGIALIGWYRKSSLVLAGVAGAAFSGAALCARTLHLGDTVDLSDAVRSLAQTPLTWAALAFGAIGALAYARALERGTVGPATAVLWVVEVIVPGVVGAVVLGDRVRPGWAAPAVIAVLAAVVACSAMSVQQRERDLL
jgi:drug/metabolite transporter (DMT)-like permease